MVKPQHRVMTSELSSGETTTKVYAASSPVLSKEVHQGQGAPLCLAHGEVKSSLKYILTRKKHLQWPLTCGEGCLAVLPRLQYLFKGPGQVSICFMTLVPVYVSDPR